MTTEIFKTTIEQGVIDLLKADAELVADGLSYVRGIAPPFVAAEHYPFAEVFVGLETPVEKETGVHILEYRGAIYFNAQMPDTLQFTGSVATVESGDSVAKWAHIAIRVLLANRKLGNLASADGKEKVRITHCSAPQYAIAESKGRSTNWDNQSEVEFTVETQREVS